MRASNDSFAVPRTVGQLLLRRARLLSSRRWRGKEKKGKERNAVGKAMDKKKETHYRYSHRTAGGGRAARSSR
jgi:hypothetical protein